MDSRKRRRGGLSNSCGQRGGVCLILVSAPTPAVALLLPKPRRLSKQYSFPLNIAPSCHLSKPLYELLKGLGYFPLHHRFHIWHIQPLRLLDQKHTEQSTYHSSRVRADQSPHFSCLERVERVAFEDVAHARMKPCDFVALLAQTCAKMCTDDLRIISCIAKHREFVRKLIFFTLCRPREQEIQIGECLHRILDLSDGRTDIRSSVAASNAHGFGRGDAEDVHAVGENRW